MNRFLVTLLSVVLMAGISQASTIYNDATGDLNDGSGGGADFTGFTFLDIASVEVSNDATDLSFSLTLVGDIQATDWGKYMIGINTNSSTGDTFGNGWGRPISMSPDGMDYWIGTWVDSGNGAEQYKWNGASWDLKEATYNGPPDNDISIATSQFTATVTVPLANLGLSPGDMFWFDAYSSGGGGGDSAVDALSSSVPSITDWPGPFNSPGDSGLRKYTVAVPEPTTLALLGLATLAMGLGCLRRWK